MKLRGAANLTIPLCLTGGSGVICLMYLCRAIKTAAPSSSVRRINASVNFTHHFSLIAQGDFLCEPSATSVPFFPAQAFEFLSQFRFLCEFFFDPCARICPYAIFRFLEFLVMAHRVVLKPKVTAVYEIYICFKTFVLKLNLIHIIFIFCFLCIYLKLFSPM